MERNQRPAGSATMGISDERDPGEQWRGPLTSAFLSQTSLVARPLFRSSPLTESLEQASVCVQSCFFFTVAVVIFYTGVNIDSNDLMVAHSKRQSLHLHWTAERKILQILQGRLKKKNCA